jgi:hypothetical protein
MLHPRKLRAISTVRRDRCQIILRRALCLVNAVEDELLSATQFHGESPEVSRHSADNISIRSRFRNFILQYETAELGLVRRKEVSGVASHQVLMRTTEIRSIDVELLD